MLENNKCIVPAAMLWKYGAIGGYGNGVLQGYDSYTNQEIEAAVEEYRAANITARDAARTEMMALLSSCDWTQLPDVEGSRLTPQEVKEWKEYRQSVFKTFKEADFNQVINWPKKPKG